MGFDLDGGDYNAHFTVMAWGCLGDLLEEMKDHPLVEGTLDKYSGVNDGVFIPPEVCEQWARVIWEVIDGQPIPAIKDKVPRLNEDQQGVLAEIGLYLAVCNGCRQW